MHPSIGAFRANQSPRETAPRARGMSARRDKHSTVHRDAPGPRVSDFSPSQSGGTRWRTPDTDTGPGLRPFRARRVWKIDRPGRCRALAGWDAPSAPGRAHARSGTAEGLLQAQDSGVPGNCRFPWAFPRPKPAATSRESSGSKVVDTLGRGCAAAFRLALPGAPAKRGA